MKNRSKRLEPGWLRKAQDAQQETNRRFADRGPVSNLPVPADAAERITPDELEESS